MDTPSTCWPIKVGRKRATPRASPGSTLPVMRAAPIAMIMGNIPVSPGYACVHSTDCRGRRHRICTSGSARFWCATNNPATGASALSYILKQPGTIASRMASAFGKRRRASAHSLPNHRGKRSGTFLSGGRNVPDVSMSASGRSRRLSDLHQRPRFVRFCAMHGCLRRNFRFSSGVCRYRRPHDQHGLSAAIEARPLELNAELYSLAKTTPAIFHDITTGNNTVVFVSPAANRHLRPCRVRSGYRTRLSRCLLPRDRSCVRSRNGQLRSPSSWPTGSASVTVTITGSALPAGAPAQINGLALTTTFVSSTTLYGYDTRQRSPQSGDAPDAATVGSASNIFFVITAQVSLLQFLAVAPCRIMTRAKRMGLSAARISAALRPARSRFLPVTVLFGQRLGVFAQFHRRPRDGCCLIWRYAVHWLTAAGRVHFEFA